MATPPKPLVLTPDALGGDVPQWARALCEQLNTYAAGVSECLDGGIARGNLEGTQKVGLVFTTKATAADTFPISVKHGLSQPPRHVVCTHLELADDPDGVVSAAWSMTSRNASDGQALVTFQGLSNSTKYRVSFTFE